MIGDKLKHSKPSNMGRKEGIYLINITKMYENIKINSKNMTLLDGYNKIDNIKDHINM